MKHYLDDYVVDLLHIKDAKYNKLIDLGAADVSKTYYLSREGNDNFSEYMLLNIEEQIGHIARMVLANSSMSKMESLVGRGLSHLSWKNGNGKQDAAALDKFIRETYKNISFKGINPLFLSVGALRWQVQVSQNEFREVLSPLLIFPIKLIRSASSTPVAIEFVDDDIYFNPCLYQKMLQTLPSDTAARFPHPNGEGATFEEPVDLEKLGDGNVYFASVERYVRECRGEEKKITFEFLKDVVAISEYEHSDLCMYYDYLRNREQIRQHHLVRSVFDPNYQPEETKPKDLSTYPYFVLPHDSVQEDMILRTLQGESMVIKGPPGTGKTITIANMIAALMAEQKNVLFVSTKISALSEVYHKLPEELRKFVLLLEYESEAQAANIDPAIIKKNLNDLIDSAKNADISDRIYTNRNAARSEQNSAISELERYYKLTFDATPIFGASYYDALVKLASLPELTPVEFVQPQRLLLLSAEQLYELLEDVRDASAEFEILSESNKTLVIKNPWYGVDESVSLSQAKAYYEKIGAQANVVKELLEDDLGSDAARFANSYRLLDMAWAREQKNCHFDIPALQKIDFKQGDYDALCQSINAFFEASAQCPKEWVDRIGSIALDELDSKFKSIPNLMLCGELRVDEIKTLHLHKDIFTDARGTVLKKEDIETLEQLSLQIRMLIKERDERLQGVWEIFRETEAEPDLKKLHDAVPVLKKYSENQATAPNAIDFKAKATIKNLLPMCYLADTSFAEIVTAVERYATVEETNESLANAKRSVAHIYKKELSDTELKNVMDAIVYGSLIGSNPSTILKLISSSAPTIDEFATVANCQKTDTVAEIKQKYAALTCYRNLASLVAKYTDCVEIPSDPSNALASAKTLAAWFGISHAREESANEAPAMMEILQKLSHETADEIERLLGSLCLFGKEFFNSYYTEAPELLTLTDAAYFSARCGDLSFANAAMRYQKFLSRHSDLLPLNEFFHPFECGKTVRESDIGFDTYFEYTLYTLATRKYRALLQEKQYTVGRAIASNYEKISRTAEQIEKLNCKIIEKKLLSYIRPDDKAYRFLNHERGANSSVRRMFVENADALLKLKKCMIMSPSTASVLLRHPDYANFDIVIIDEASQMESVTLLPVLFRAKQCVIVGDEWQMPPIKHFESKIDSLQYREDEDLPETSALSLALKNAAFHTSTLICHYRSRTESLIKFSQESFYPNMRTFPSPIPKHNGLGFSCIYLPKGECVNGVNEVEAKQTVACIRRHFERYYDVADNRLTRSFGVVTFGLPQLNRIKTLIKQDSEFAKRWHHNAERTNVDDPFFYCTVETVQGQQTTDLYLSMTYTGHSSLSQTELGSQIFNVAVSRATDSVTVIHSVASQNTKPDYVRRYLEVAEYFAEDGHSPFVCGKPDNHFVALLQNYIIEKYGIEAERVLCDYGATEGSIRIPLVILSPDRESAQLGIFFEVPSGQYNYVDYHVRYYNILSQMRAWNLHRVFVHDWFENAAAEKQMLDDVIRRYVSL